MPPPPPPPPPPLPKAYYITLIDRRLCDEPRPLTVLNCHESSCKIETKVRAYDVVAKSHRQIKWLQREKVNRANSSYRSYLIYAAFRFELINLCHFYSRVENFRRQSRSGWCSRKMCKKVPISSHFNLPCNLLKGYEQVWKVSFGANRKQRFSTYVRLN